MIVAAIKPLQDPLIGLSVGVISTSEGPPPPNQWQQRHKFKQHQLTYSSKLLRTNWYTKE